MRVLAVREVGDLLVRLHHHRREVVLLLGEPARDRGVVARRVRERLGRQRLARAERQLPLGVLELLQHGVVHLGPGHDRREREVLRRRADHRRPADVDVLDHLVLGRPATRGGPLERVEVHAHQVDELDLLLLGGEHVIGVVAQRQQPGVELRMERLDPAAHDLGEAGEVLDRADLQPRLGELARGAAGRDQLDAELRQPAREIGDAALVGHRQQRAPDADVTRLRHLGRTIQAAGGGVPRARRSARPGSDSGHARTVTCRGSAGSTVTAPRAISATTPVSRSCSTGRSAARTSSAAGRPGSVDRPLGDDRPGVDALVDEVDGHAEHLHPVGDGLLDRRRCPGKAGSSAGCTLMTRCGKRARNPGSSSCM